MSKVIEKAVSAQFTKHANEHHLEEELQSAYKNFHSTETALLKIVNDFLVEADNQKVVMVAFLDLSAAFDTVDHDILVNRLRTLFGINDTALEWCRSYLKGRTQAVKINNELSSSKSLTCRVPQGSGLGPNFYCKYTIPVGIIIRIFLILFHMFADDSQLYKAIKAKLIEEQLKAKQLIELCIQEISYWMDNNHLKFNEEKTEFLIIGTPKQGEKMVIDSLNIGGVEIKSSPYVRNLGVLLDSGLTMRHQVNSVCKSCYIQLRNIIHIRPYLTIGAAKIIVNSIITSRLDYCNSLLYGISASSTNFSVYKIGPSELFYN